MTTSNTSPIWTLRSDFGKLHKTSEGASFRELETSWGRQCLQCKTSGDSSASFIERVCDFGTSFERVDWIAGVSTEPGGLHPTFLLSRAARQSAWAENAKGLIVVCSIHVFSISMLFEFIWYMCKHVQTVFTWIDIRYPVRLAQRFSPRPRSCKLHWFCCCELLGRLNRIKKDQPRLRSAWNINRSCESPRCELCACHQRLSAPFHP